MKLFQIEYDRTQMSQDNSKLIEKLKSNIKLNAEIIVNLKEFFGTYLSNFLKEYRVNVDSHNPELEQIMTRQDEIYQNMQNLMKSEKNNEQRRSSILELEGLAKTQREIIVLIKEFFTSNSEFMKLYRNPSLMEYVKMNKILDEQLNLFHKLEFCMNRD